MIKYQESFAYMEMECDSCGESVEFDGDWQECINQAKDLGWWIYKEGQYWEHYCPGCKQENR